MRSLMVFLSTMGSSLRVSPNPNLSLFLKSKPLSCTRKKDWSVTNKGTPPLFNHTLYIVKISQEEGFTTLLVVMVQVDQELMAEGAVVDIIPFLPHKVVVQNSNVNFVVVLVILRFTVGIVLMNISLNQPYL